MPARRKAICLAIVVLAIVTLFWGVDGHPDSGLPDGWDLEEIARAAVDAGDAVLDSDVLIWKVERDGRPFVVESCILWLHLQDSEGETSFRVARLYRHPNWHNRWSLAVTETLWDRAGSAGGSPVRFDESFASPPTAAQVLDFVGQSGWTWELKWGGGGILFDRDARKGRRIDGFEYLDGRVCLDAWERRTGSPFTLDVPLEYLR